MTVDRPSLDGVDPTAAEDGPDQRSWTSDIDERDDWLRRWALLLVAPAIWMVLFFVVYLPAEAVCRTAPDDEPATGVLRWGTIVATGLAVALTAWSTARLVRTGRDHGVDGPTLRTAAVLLGGLFCLAALFIGLPVLVLGPC